MFVPRKEGGGPGRGLQGAELAMSTEAGETHEGMVLGSDDCWCQAGCQGSR